MNKRVLITSILIVILVALFWGGSRYPELDEKAMMAGDASTEDSLSFEAWIHIDDSEPMYKQIVLSTLNWGYTNRKGMTFGVLLGAAFLSLLSFLPAHSTRNSFVNAMKGSLAGAPLGVCANCAAPIAQGMYDAGSRMETALATMFSSPTLNIIVLTMLFSLFPLYMGITKIVVSLAFILLLVPLLTKLIVTKQHTVKHHPHQECVAENWLSAIKGTGKSLGHSLMYIVKITVPLMILAGFLGTVVAKLIPLESIANMAVNWKTLTLTAFVGLNLLQSAFTHWCLMEKILMKAGVVNPARWETGHSYLRVRNT